MANDPQTKGAVKSTAPSLATGSVRRAAFLESLRARSPGGQLPASIHFPPDPVEKSEQGKPEVVTCSRSVPQALWPTIK
jgi:hypothetical protein